MFGRYFSWIESSRLIVVFFCYFTNIASIIFFLKIFIWLHRVLVAANGPFAVARGTFLLWWSGFSLDITCGLPSVQAQKLRGVWGGNLTCRIARGILVPQTGIEPEFSALKGRFLTTGSLGKSLLSFFFFLTFVDVSLVYSIICLMYAIVYFSFGIYCSMLPTRIRLYIHHCTIDLFPNFALPPPLFLW